VSSFQLHWTSTVEFLSGAVLNIAPDHLDWHGSLEAYAADKALVWRSDWYAVYNADDPLVASLVTRVDDRQSFSVRPGSDACFGLADDALVDRCIGTDPGEAVERVPDGGVVLGRLSDIPVAGVHNVANALAAAGLARCLNSATAGRLAVRPQDVSAGLRAFDPGPHRIAHVATVEGVDYVDDSKATNAHAAAASLAAFRPVVWIAGGLAKGAEFGELVAGAADRLRGVVLLGRDRALIADALARHAPEVPVVDVPATDTGAMDDVVRAARGLARPGDTVLLAPACASMDMFTNYGERGDAFADAVRRQTP
jgi:UDP-N-acetylmuramoylalanine--D-glutamate ligase